MNNSLFLRLQKILVFKNFIGFFQKVLVLKKNYFGFVFKRF